MRWTVIVFLFASLAVSVHAACTSLATWTWRSGAQTNPPGTPANTSAATTFDIGQRFATVTEDTANGALVFGGQSASGVLSDLWHFNAVAGGFQLLTGVASTTPNLLGVYTGAGKSLCVWFCEWD
jgi:hypothetical protein